MGETPDTLIDHSDPGDETQNRFRYQHAYGIVLLIAAIKQELPYVALWCEHWEDFLAERVDGRFASYQVKTRKPENGPWKFNDDAFVKSIKRFVQLDEEFPDKILHHHFVSNLNPFHSSVEKEKVKCPGLILQTIACSEKIEKLAETLQATIGALADNLTVSTDKLYSTLKRTKFIKGPSLDGYDSEVAHLHLANCDFCSKLNASQLNGVRDELIHLIYRASSLGVDDPAIHWVALGDPDSMKPQLYAKRVSVDDVKEQVLARDIGFRFTPSDGIYSLKKSQGSHKSALEQKFSQGGLGQYQDFMKWRAMSAEEHLLELVARDPDKANLIVDQLRGVVQGTCLDAHAQVSGNPEPWEPAMYKKVIDDLKRIHSEEPSNISFQDFNCLMGVAGLLTDECLVWWSPEFELEDQ